MKLYLRAWLRGIGVVGLYVCLSIIVVAAGFLADVLPMVIGLPLFLIIVPPLLYWTFRWVYPDVGSEKDCHES